MASPVEASEGRLVTREGEAIDYATGTALDTLETTVGDLPELADIFPLSFLEDYISFVDDFTGTNTEAGVLNRGWVGTATNSGTIANAANTHSGVATLSTFTASATGAYEIAHTNTTLVVVAEAIAAPSFPVIEKWRVSHSAMTDAQAATIEFGWKGTSDTDARASFEFVGDTTPVFSALTHDGTTAKRTALAVWADDTFVDFEIRFTATGNWQFWRAGALVAEHVATDTVPGPAIETLVPFMKITKTNGTGTARTANIDYYAHLIPRV
jgi:hypothetical protein